MHTPRTVQIAVLLAGSLVGSAAAQTPKTQEAFAKGPHTGPVEQALVGVTSRFYDNHSQLLEERHGTGMMLRCDGFVLFSAAMLDHRGDEPDDIRPAIEITLNAGT